MSFSPHTAGNARLKAIGDDIETQTESSLFYSLAFLYQTKGAIRDAITKVTANPTRFVYGISDRKVGGGLDVQKPNGNVKPVYPAQLAKNLPQPFKAEPTGGSGSFGTRMHHKFVVIDFDNPATARVYPAPTTFRRRPTRTTARTCSSSAISESPSRISSKPYASSTTTTSGSRRTRKAGSSWCSPGRRERRGRSRGGRGNSDARKIRDRQLFA